MVGLKWGSHCACALAAAWILTAPLGAADGTLGTLVGPSQNLDGLPGEGTSLGTYTSTVNGVPYSGVGGLAVDAVGNAYFTDSGSNRVLRLDRGNGQLSTVAGTGAGRFGGDNGPAVDACLLDPTGLALDPPNLYVSDSGNNRIRQINLETGLISTVAGNGNAANDGNGGYAVAASIGGPGPICARNGTVYFYDGSGTVRYFSPGGLIGVAAGNGGYASTPADGGNGGPATAAPVQPVSAMALGPDDALYLVIQDRLRRVSPPVAGTILSVAGSGGASPADSSYTGGPAASAALGALGGLAFDPSGHLIFGNVSSVRLQSVTGVTSNAATATIATIAGNGTNGFSSDGAMALGSAIYSAPTSIAIAANGDAFLTEGKQILRINGSDGRLYLAGGRWQSSATFPIPASNFVPFGAGPMAALPGGDFVFYSGWQDTQLSSSYSPRLWRYSAATASVTLFAGDGSLAYSGPGGNGDGGAAVSAGLGYVQAMAGDGAGNIYFGGSDFTVRKVDPQGIISSVAGNETYGGCADGQGATMCGQGHIYGLAVGANRLYFSEDSSPSMLIRAVDLRSGLLSTLTGQGGSGYKDGSAATALFGANNIGGMASDGGNYLYVADPVNNAVRRVDLVARMVSTVCGLGPSAAGYYGDGGAAVAAALNAPSSLCLDGKGGLLISDSGNNRVRRVDLSSGIITTVIGDGYQGFAGDGQAATAGMLSNPGGMMTTALGDIIFCDSGNNRVRGVIYPKVPVPSSALGKPVAYPSPADHQVCFSFQASAPGAVTIEVYNVAFKKVARFTDSAAAAGTQVSCADVSQLARGPYIYRILATGTQDQTGKFKVIH